MSATARQAVLVMGSANLDMVVRVAHVPAPGETVMGSGAGMYPGGKGANQAVACARAGDATTRMLVALGDDAHAVMLEQSLCAAGVLPEVVRVPGSASGMAFVCVADNAENAITVAAGANDFLCASHLPPLHGISHLLLQLETPVEAVAEAARRARAAGVQVVLNAAPARPLPAALLKAVDVLVVNEGELAAISGCDGGVAAMLAGLDVPCVIVTLGARGCIARAHGELFLQTSFPVDAVDTTAAGDTFCGVLVATLSQGGDLPAALRRASAAAALACTRPGAQSSIPTHAEVDAFVQFRGQHAGSTQDQERLAAYCGLA